MSFNIVVRILCISYGFFFLATGWAQTQRSGYRDMSVPASQQVVVDLREGEQLMLAEGWQEGRVLSALQTLEVGYVLGNNNKSDVEHGQVFPFDAMQRITGVCLGVETSGKVSGEVLIKVRQFGRLPGRLIGEAVWSLDSLADGVHWKQMRFLKPVIGKGRVIISMDVSGVKSGHIGLLSQRTDTDRIWTKTTERKWHPQETLWSKPAVIAAMWPVVQLRSDFAGGSGTLEDPYQVASAEQLNAVREYLSSHFIQVADIDLGQDPWNTGEGWMPVGGETPFSGTYNGGGYTISGLTIDRPKSDYQGLFGRVSGSRLWNLTLEAADVRGRDYTGALIGMALSSELQTIRVDGKIEGNEYAGGICGAMYRGKMDQSESAAEVTGHSFVGGLAGTGEAHACTSGGTISGAEEGHRVGGLLGEGLAVNSVASGSVSGGSEVGGLIGRGEAYGSRATGAVQGSGDYVGGLIGELAVGTSADDDGVYGPGETSPGDTTRLKDILQIPGSGRIDIVLEDGTRFVMEGNGSEMTAEAGRGPVDIAISNYVPESAGFRVTGSMRTLEVRGSGDPVGIKPIISIPMEEIGSVNPETVVILRIGSLGVDGEWLEDHGVVLPILRIEDNKLKFIDALFPDCAMLEEGLENEPGSRVDGWVGNVRYALLTYDMALNWSKRPELERMIPDIKKSEDGFRQLWRRSSKEEQTKLRRQPICNIVLLVHGHNEEEKDGFVGNKIVTPWEFGYKRLVWDLLYEEFSKNSYGDVPEECTAFYEFIFPTYRPIFSPVLEKSGFRMPTLGEDMGRMVNERLLGDEQIKKMLDEGMAFNLYVVSHSQGGLVSRAGLRHMDERLLKNLKKVISWGSPHRGAGLYSLRYALTAGHDMIIDDIRFPLQNIGQSSGYQNGVAGIALDAPGIRDLRWDVSKKEMLRLGELLRENSATLNEFPDSELPYGRMFFSDNLKIFNETEGSENGDFLQNKYMFYRGVTPKLASLEVDSWLFLWQVYKFAKRATSIEKGAQLNRLVMTDLHKDSDGAAPLYTQGAIDVFPGGGIQRRIFQDVDHEEFYGSEEPQRNESTKDKGRMIAKETFSDLGLTWPRSRCPKLEWVERDETDTLKFEGMIRFPIYDVSEGGDGKPGRRIKEMVIRADARDANNLQGIVYQVMENGEWNVSVAKSILGSVQDTLFITAVLKDGSEVYGGVKVAGFARVFNRTQRKWYGNIQAAISASVSGDTIMVKPGLYKESIEQVSMFQKDLKIWSYDGAAVTILESPVARQFNGFIVSRSIEISGFTFRDFNDAIVLQGEIMTNGENFQKTIKNNIFQNCKRAIHTLQINNVTISDNEFIENEEYAISIFRDNDKTTSDNTFLISGNKIQGGFQGIRLRTGLSLPEAADPFRAQISDNRISQCTGDGIQLNGSVGAHLVFNNITSCQGTGISIRNGSAQATSTLVNNEVRQCLTGIDIGNYGHFTLSANTIVSNTETGVLLTLETGSAAIEQNIFQNNSPNGSPGWPTPGLSLWIYDNTVTVNGNQFLSNQNGGIHIASGGGNLSIQQNTFTDNTSDYGGAIYSGGSIKSVVSNIFESNRAIDGGAFYGRAEQLSGNQFLNNFASNRGGAIKGGASNWPGTATVTVAGQMIQVPRYVPCFAEPTNTYSGNAHGSVFGAWGPGTDNWCQSAGYDVHD